MHIYLHQQNKSYSLVLGQSYTYACINRIKCLAGPKGLLVIPCIQGIIGWTKVVNIYNFIKEGLGLESDHTFRGALVIKSGVLHLHPFENLAILGLKGLNRVSIEIYFIWVQNSLDTLFKEEY